MANTLDTFTEATTAQDDDLFHLRRGSGTDSDKRISKQNLQASLQSSSNPDQIYGGVLLSGSVTWISGLIFDVSPCSYLIDGVAYTSAADQVTLAAADAANPRIDVIYVDNAGLVGAITGTPAADPAKAEIDPTTQLELTFIVVQALATEPDNVDVQSLYLEDAGDAAEWDATESTTGARIDLADISDPYAGTNAILLSAAVVDDFFTLASGSAGTLLTVGDLDSLETHIKPSTWANNARVRVAFFYGANRVSAWVNIGNNTFGFDPSTASYQTVTIPNSAFAFTGQLADSLVFEVNRGTITALIDNIRVQKGGGTTIINVTQGLTEDQLVNNVRTWNAQQLPSSGTLTDAATVTWDLDLYQVAKVTLAGNRVLSFSNLRAGGTYILWVYQSAGSNTLDMTAADWPGGTPPTLSTAAAAYDVFTFTVAPDGTTIVGATGGLEFG